MDDYPQPGQNEFSADEEKQMRANRRTSFMGSDTASKNIDTLESIGNSVRIKPEAWDNFIKNSPKSKNIEDRRGWGEHDAASLIRRPIEAGINAILK
jgi:hypothetical protein